MGMLSNIKNLRKALAITNALKSKSEDELNNLLFDLRVLYKVSDDDWMRIEAGVALLTQRKLLEQMGLKNDVVLDDNLGGGSDVGSV